MSERKPEDDVIASPVTHIRGKSRTERWHWRVEISQGFSFRGDNTDLMGWTTKAAATRAGRRTMREYFAKGKRRG